MFETESLNILYGVQATGNGHITRSREVVTALKQRGHSVQVIVSGRPEKDLWGMQSFQPFQVMEGLTFQSEKGKVKNFSTLLNARPLKMIRDINNYDASQIDLVISDYEPISARIAQKHGIPSIGLGHQYAFQYAIPTAAFNPITRSFMQKFAPVDLGVGLHWYHFDSPILPPIISPLIQQGPQRKGQVLVYLPFEDLRELVSTLREIVEMKFIVYTNMVGPQIDNNIELKALSLNGFQQDLIESEAVLCNAGFELPSEALSLGKKLLVKPLHGQPEQESNALALKKLHAGTVCHQITADGIRQWYRLQPSTRIVFPYVVPDLIDWIEWGQWDLASLSVLARELWDKTRVENVTLQASGKNPGNDPAKFEWESQEVLNLQGI